MVGGLSTTTDPISTDNAKAIVKSFHDGGARGEITSFADRLAENFERFVPHFNKAQYLSILPRVAATLDFARMHYISLTAEGQTVMALIDTGVQDTNKSAPSTGSSYVDAGLLGPRQGSPPQHLCLGSPS